jgi:hypothetical protein
MSKLITEKLSGEIKFERNINDGCKFTFKVQAFNASLSEKIVGDDFSIEIMNVKQPSKENSFISSH